MFSQINVRTKSQSTRYLYSQSYIISVLLENYCFVFLYFPCFLSALCFKFVQFDNHICMIDCIGTRCSVILFSNRFVKTYKLFSQINVRTKSQSRQKTRKTQEDETVVFQKNRYSILTYIKPFEQSNDHRRISYEIEFCSPFKSEKRGRLS